MSETRRIVKIVLQMTCQLLWLVGLVVGLSGMYLLLNFKYNRLFFNDIYIILPAVLATASAVALLTSGVVGCWLTVRDSTCLQAVFVYLLIIIFCLEATAAALAYVNIGKVHSELAPFQSIFQNYSGSSQDPGTNAVDSIQEEGCQVKLEDAVSFILHVIIYSSAAVAVVQFVGLISVAQLMKLRPLHDYQILDRDTMK